ncbi:4-hydroxy-tetrahydrodipicolinate reductase [Sporosarcina sp. NCCP-2716]|uniref:4-hydroxy-tetrahydrodipicolinate reductase n=1 Tax=Sporosarcina sp. NCCP-2716 TaxID=2943679 RepID=UPI002041154D|nr:4-hydroxy-tetrahydrodipicolinate reductase [Sporosarcina sp. NCCP-2716]GKV67966.1 4-hydroxy-tetrahydrodipicolinate reductase [Sporosarcina sp. NCCP-2716]
MTIRVAIAGIRGRMGSTAAAAISEAAGMKVVAALDYKYDGMYASEGTVTAEPAGVRIYTSLVELNEQQQPDVLLDLTDPEAVFPNARKAMALGICSVVGTSGLTIEELGQLQELSEQKGIACIIAPNFSIGAVLMMKFAAQAAHYLGDVEIIEMHHDRKLDAPSGTAVKTADMIAQVRTPHLQGHPDEQVHAYGARGADVQGMKIHSVRLPGLLAHQQVMLGGEGELLTIRHDSFDRKSFMPGVLLAIRESMQRPEFVNGLEHLIQA